MGYPIIGLSANLLIIETGVTAGGEKCSVNYDYVAAIRQAGGIPVILPCIAEREAIREQARLCDGLLLTGGYDIHPLQYGEQPKPGLGFVYPQIDEYEILLIDEFYRTNKPILGICRGIQILNVAFGGTLCQDLSGKVAGCLQHMQKARKDAVFHGVTIKSETILHDIFACRTMWVNSFHHQAVDKVAPGFTISSWSEDGMVEGIEKQGQPFVIGVQWHPEMMLDRYPAMHALFHRLVTEAATVKKARTAGN